MGPTGVKDYGTNEAFKGQPWGAFPAQYQPPPYWGLINSDGTIQASSGNFTVTVGSTGVYVMQPRNPDGSALHLVEAQCLPLFVSRGGPAPFLPGFQYGAGATGDGIEVQFFNAAAAGAAVNTAFVFAMWLSN